MIAVALALQAAPLTTGDWMVVCDVRRQCTALSQVPSGAPVADYPLLVIRRAGSAVVLDLPVPAGIARGTRLSLAVDGRTVAQLVAPGGGGGLSLPVVGGLAAPLSKGASLTLVDPRGRTRARASLKGYDAARSAVDIPISSTDLSTTPSTADGRQRRIGRRPGATALLNTPSTDLSTASSTVIQLPTTSDAAPRTIARKQLARMVAPRPGCGQAVARSYRLDVRTTLLAVEPPCPAAARRTLFYTLGEKGDPVPAIFDAPASTSPLGYEANGGWDPQRRRIAVLLPPTGRLCGIERSFAWDGARFRLVEEQVIAECRRTTYRVTTFITTVR